MKNKIVAVELSVKMNTSKNVDWAIVLEYSRVNTNWVKLVYHEICKERCTRNAMQEGRHIELQWIIELGQVWWPWIG